MRCRTPPPEAHNVSVGQFSAPNNIHSVNAAIYPVLSHTLPSSSTHPSRSCLCAFHSPHGALGYPSGCRCWLLATQNLRCTPVYTKEILCMACTRSWASALLSTAAACLLASSSAAPSSAIGAHTLGRFLLPGVDISLSIPVSIGSGGHDLFVDVGACPLHGDVGAALHLTRVPPPLLQHTQDQGTPSWLVGLPPSPIPCPQLSSMSQLSPAVRSRAACGMWKRP